MRITFETAVWRIGCVASIFLTVLYFQKGDWERAVLLALFAVYAAVRHHTAAMQSLISE